MFIIIVPIGFAVNGQNPEIGGKFRRHFGKMKI